MSILNWFNKPKWQNPNEQVRITAIQTSDDIELINSLPEIVNNDVSEKVQKTALSRIKNPQTILNISQHHPNKIIKQLANKKLVNWFKSDNNDEQLGLFKNITDAETIKTVAQHAQNTAVREHALKQIKQQGLLSELLLKEIDLGLQELILEKIEQPVSLTRLLKKAGKKHSSLKQLIQQRLAQDIPEDQSEQAINLCTELEEVVHGRNQSVDLNTISNNWQAVEAQVSDALKMRYNGAYAAAKMILDPEHRSQFLKKQKQQRAVAQLNDLELLLSKQNDWSLQSVQSNLTKYQDIESQDLSSEHAANYQQAMEKLATIKDEIQTEQQIPAAATETLNQINKLLSQAIIQPDKLKQCKQQWQKATRKMPASEALTLINEQFNQACLKLAEKIEQSAQLRDKAAADAVAMIEPTIVQIKEGHLLKAKKMTNQIAEHKKTAGFNHPTIKNNKYPLDSVWQQLKDLRNWQKWSNDKARQDIINELHKMIGKGQHPDAVLKKLKDSNERWYVLEDMEKLPGDKFSSRNQKMWQEFRIVSKALFEPTQPFFEKRSEQQDSYFDSIQAHMQAMNDTDLDEAEGKDLAQMSRDAIKHLKSLDNLPPKQRGATAKKLRAAINRIDKKLNEFYSDAENKKLKLIEMALQLSAEEDNYAAIEMAKSLQQQWKTAGTVKQHTERKLWKKFRQANDAVFNRRDAEKQQQHDASQAQRKQAQDLLSDLNKELKKAKSIEALQHLKSDINKQWHGLEKPAKFLDVEYNHLLQNIDDQLKTIQFKAELKQYKDKQKLDEVFSQFEQGAIDVDEKQQKTKKLLTDELSTFFAQRQDTDSDTDHLASQLIQAEFITGLETPEQFIGDRMAYQVRILSMRMSGEKTANNQTQATAWLDHWFLSPKIDAAFIKTNNKRIKNAIKAMLELILE
ncbi:hypothetical protein MNBD_GAMMA02-992 [hydrothermal vent metagenome]|uniref:DUF349 domain-containing protein n=1 Tax=hydrothermal vent metagenome TaxID=652676 RepID=A0A3B0VVJ2_9ZZZZ